MKHYFILLLFVFSTLSLASLTAIVSEEEINNDNPENIIYVATNKIDGNSIVAIRQNKDGSLVKIGEYQTGGRGTGNIEIFDWGYDSTHPLKDGVDPLISAYGVFKSQDNKHILVVNSGNGTVSSLSVQPDKSLKLNNVVSAGEKHPLSIASHGKMVYVASAGTVASPPFSGNLTGYKIEPTGELIELKGSTRDLRARPSCIAFTSDGKYLVVNELVSGLIKVYSVNPDGMLSNEPISSTHAPHATEKGRWLPIPVGFDIIKRGNNHIVLVSEARFLNNEGMLREETDKVPQSPKYSWQTGSTSSYILSNNGEIKLVSGDVMTGNKMEGGQIANCWIETSNDGRTLWAANALSSSISSYSIEDNGILTLVNETAYKKADESLFFSDLYLGEGNKFLNQLIGNKGAIHVFEVITDEGKEKKLKSLGMYSEFGIPEIGSYGLISIN